MHHSARHKPDEAAERAEHLPTLETDVEMAGAGARRRVARETLAFAAALGARR